MLVPLSNTPRDYAWGSTTLLADLEGRTPSGAPEAELWFGDHPGSPAATADGRTLDRWFDDERGGERLPFLLKLLAAASPLSIQIHPSIDQAREGFAREERAGIPRDAGERTYRDDNHKPELIVALSPAFTALAGLRDADATRRLLSEIGPAANGLAEKMTDAASAVAWVLSADAADDVRGIIAAARSATSSEFADEVALVARLDDQYPGDPGIVVAMLMNLVTLRAGEGLFLPAGVLHAYLEGLGVEIMAASDNVLRGGLTPKHIDVEQLVAVLDARSGAVPIVQPQSAGAGAEAYPVPVDDFALTAAHPRPEATVSLDIAGTSIALATRGAVEVSGAASGTAVRLAPGEAVLVTPDERSVVVSGDGELFLASPGR